MELFAIFDTEKTRKIWIYRRFFDLYNFPNEKNKIFEKFLRKNILKKFRKKLDKGEKMWYNARGIKQSVSRSHPAAQRAGVDIFSPDAGVLGEDCVRGFSSHFCFYFKILFSEVHTYQHKRNADQ